MSLVLGLKLETALQIANQAMLAHLKRGLSDVETVILRGAWDGQTYEEIAQNSAYSDSYLRRNIGPKLWKGLSEALGETVSKPNFREALDRYRSVVVEPPNVALPTPSAFLIEDPADTGVNASEVADSAELSAPPSAPIHSDWGEALDVSLFVGRLTEQATLKQWIVRDRCRLVLLLGTGGMGKTALAIHLGQQMQAKFDFVIWRSLRKAPPLQELLTDLVKFLAQKQDIEMFSDVNDGIAQLLQYLCSHRCLLILDNAEALPRAGDDEGSYQAGYEGYSQLFQSLGETAHQSCLVVTSRERPEGIVAQSERNLPVRSLTITGLSCAEGQALLTGCDKIMGTTEDWQLLNDRYAGNPLALKIAASFVSEFFAGDLRQFLDSLGQSSLVFDDIRDLLERPF
ncbi:MAG: NB-ARC domain-containing protein [Cyanobacteria bacterium P01_F01_bin.86]